MDENRRPCPGCSDENARYLGCKNEFDIFVCSGCSTIFTDRVPFADEAENYDDYYSETNLSVPTFISSRLTEIIGGFMKYRQTNRLLDIGFGAGTLMGVARDLGWNAHGQEVSAPAVKQAKDRGFDVFHGDLFSANYPAEHFDVVTCSEIIEHLPNPKDVLDEVARILRKGGLFWATTPSATSLSFKLLKTDWTVLSPPEHTQLYSSNGMREMLKHSGFANITLKTAGLNPNEIINFYRPKSSGAKFERVATSYELNEKLTRSPLRKGIKNLLNGVLNLFGAGDSMKIFAER